jgi:hypothetical protein
VLQILTRQQGGTSIWISSKNRLNCFNSKGKTGHFQKTKQLTITIKPSLFTNSLFECENQNSKAHSSQVHKVDPVVRLH